MSALVVGGLSAGYGTQPVLDAITFSVSQGHCLALLGPNGSGKSTLMKAMLGLTPWRRGTIHWEGRSVVDLAPGDAAKLIAYVPQSETPNFPFPVDESVRLGRLPHGSAFFDSPEDYALAQDAMRQADCLDLAHRLITELSGGELQRVLLARALAQATPVLLLDEPTAHLDARHVVDFVRIVGDLKAAGKTLILAAHDLNLARHCADLVLLLDHGTCAALGPTPEIMTPGRLEPVFGARFRALEDGWLAPEWG